MRTKSRRETWRKRYAAHREVMEKVIKIYVRVSLSEETLKWRDDNINIDPGKTGCSSFGWIKLIHKRAAMVSILQCFIFIKRRILWTNCGAMKGSSRWANGCRLMGGGAQLWKCIYTSICQSIQLSNNKDTHPTIDKPVRHRIQNNNK